MNSQEITIQAKDGSFKAYVVGPDKGPAPGLVIIQEIFGINSVMRSIADTFAEMGYIAVVPDLFWRQAPGVQLTDTGADLERAYELYGSFSEDTGVEDLIATLGALKNLDGCNGKVGTVGYCLGGKLAYLMATRSDSDCNVSYYGVGVEKNLDELDKVRHPLLMHLAENDELVTPEARAQIVAAAAENVLVNSYTYPEVGHAFARVGGSTYRPEAAELANDRTRVFFSLQLGNLRG